MYEAKYFDRSEFECSCGCGLDNIDDMLLSALDSMRGICGFPFHVTSGCRCEAHNKAIGGAEHSPHKPDEKGVCHAADIKIVASRDRAKFIYDAARVGINRVGVASNFIHVDSMNDEKHVPHLIWHYKR